MSRNAQTWFRSLRIGMSPVEKIVGGELAYRAEDETHLAWPTLARLAADTEVSKRTVQRTLEALQDRGVIIDTTVRRDSGAVVYRLAVDLEIIARVAGKNGHPPADREDSQNGHASVAKMATPPIAKMATLNYTIEEATQSNSQTPANAKPALSRFDEFWAAYPRKVGKPDAVKAFTKALKKTDFAGLMVGLKGYRFSEDPQYIPHPATWLNKERWVLELVEPRPTADDDPYGAAAWLATVPVPPPDPEPPTTPKVLNERTRLWPPEWEAHHAACRPVFSSIWDWSEPDVAQNVREVCEAAGFSPSWRGKLDWIADICADRFNLESVISVIREEAQASPGKAMGLRYFDGAVRARALRWDPERCDWWTPEQKIRAG